ncbi:alpha/beta hydrolase [Mycobacterium intracellulare]|uniref:alpha/beta hydrolase n=1 Tax=Mycobacterium intracellulare TaxID=1767 RepID=UPI002010425B|nr:alpha/beta hydrolase [Mycobacterium intracellulare]UQB93105.1 alpha/beta hydrolase [Mycobacterium intracellulare]
MEQVYDRRVLVTGGSVPLRIVVPNDAPSAVIVFYHGGGWVLGSVDNSELIARHLAERTGAAVVVVGYRLAPEYRFPTAIDDSYAALCWVDDNIDKIAGKRVPLVVMGDSSGGNLAAVMALKSRDRGHPRLDAQILVYPITDCDFETTSYKAAENQLLVNRDVMMWFWDHYAPDPASRMHPDASPVRVVNMANLPPAVVITAEYDVLRDEGEVYATRLIKAGIPVEHMRFEGQMHSFVTMIGLLPASTAALDYIAAALERQLPNVSRPLLGSATSTT